MTIGRERVELRGVAFVGGGSGGHLQPGIAVAERVRARFPGARVVFFRTGRDVDQRVLASTDFESHHVTISPPGRTAGGWLRYSREAWRTTRQIRATLSEGIDVVFGLGGYASLPGILAARRASVPTILLEQNATVGKVNSLLAPWVDRVCCAYGGTRFRAGARPVVTGNPVRADVLEAALWRRLSRGGGGIRRVLVVGGSQGAHGLNRAVRRALAELDEFRGKIHWIHITGYADQEIMEEAYRKSGHAADVHAYSSRLPYLMGSSDLVISRAGGTTLAELAALGVPSLLIPYPHHRDRHQESNAQLLVEAGAARSVSEGDLDATCLRGTFRELLFCPPRLDELGTCARRLSRPRAADDVVDHALELVEARPACRSRSVSSW